MSQVCKYPGCNKYTVVAFRDRNSGDPDWTACGTKLDFCFEHNVCKKCGKKTAWWVQLCSSCDDK